LPGAGVGKAVGVGAGLDDVAADGEPIYDRSTQAGIGEGGGQAPERSSPSTVLGVTGAARMLAFGELAPVFRNFLALTVGLGGIVKTCG
jgi:hypothetical protein